MPESVPTPIAPPPGVVLTETERVIAGRWSASDKVRFVRGRPEKRGGWVKAYTAATSGTPRAIHAWRDLSANQFLAAGTYRKLYVYDSNLGQNDVTPLRATGTLPADPFTPVAIGSSLVAVHHPGHGVNPGDTVIFAGSLGLGGGLNPNGTWAVASVSDLNNYLFDATVPAISTAAGGGAAATFQYEIPVGSELGVYGLGFGVGPWGIGTWGTPRSSSTIFVEPRVWSLDHFGKLLVAAYNGGSIYLFDPSQAQPWPRAALVSSDPNLPADCRFVFVTAERFVVALRENMVVSWASQGDPSSSTAWTPLPTNTANTRTLTEGTKLVAGRVLQPFVSLIWSDAACYRMQWTGDQYVHNTGLIGRDCGLIAPGAAVTVNGVAYWMGHETFLQCDGLSVAPMPNVEDVRKFVFNNLQRDYGYQCSAAYNPKFHEVEFFYTETGATNPSRSVIFHINDRCWSPHVLARTAGTHFTQGDTRPYLAGTDGFIYQHENGFDAAGSPLPYSLTLARYALENGARAYEIDGLEPDFRDQAGSIVLTVSTYDRLRDAAALESGTEIVQPADVLVDLRASGRYLGLGIAGSDAGSFFRWGEPQAFLKPAGARR